MSQQEKILRIQAKCQAQNFYRTGNKFYWHAYMTTLEALTQIFFPKQGIQQ